LHIDPTTQTTELLIWNPLNTLVPRHWHSANGKISIISGTFVMKDDDRGDPVSAKPGGFVYEWLSGWGKSTARQFLNVTRGPSVILHGKWHQSLHAIWH
jgi:hypothetical protein